MTEGLRVPKDSVFIRAPRIFAMSLLREYGDFAKARPHMDDCHHWMASAADQTERLVIHGVIDRQKHSLKQAMVLLHVGVIAVENMTALWLRIEDPNSYIQFSGNSAPAMPAGLQLEDPLIDYLSEKFANTSADQGILVKDETLLKRIAEYSEFLTVLDTHTGGYFNLPDENTRQYVLN
jgi:hypothetical protein